MNIKEKIHQRNKLFKQIREFFEQKNVSEVDTSLLAEYSVTDPYMSAFSAISPSGKHQGFLQTSPEYAMKKLLCAGSGDIYQLSKMFRADEKGAIHANEFTMLEWYRTDFDHHQLIQEICQLINKIIGKKEVEILSYQQVFWSKLSIDPFAVTLDKLRQKTADLLGDIPNKLLFDNYLSLLFSEKIEPSFNPNKITIVHSFPENQASLAKTRMENGLVIADRFEVYLAGMELANGFNELTDVEQQYQRFEQDNKIRKQLGLTEMEIDPDFIRALKNGLPDCAGVALGLDRLLMIKLEKDDINDVILRI